MKPIRMRVACALAALREFFGKLSTDEARMPSPRGMVVAAR